ncbi:MAG TPA: ATP-dependent RecD-like DNA helicase, partial [Clostridiales bacterium]|nr:ATP-dependent RecD-like DNA helicase [Clostridiales bacterium]
MQGSKDPRQQDLGQLASQDDYQVKQTLDAVIEDIIYRNESNGYTVVSLAGAGERIAVGIMPYLAEGESVCLTGYWAQHPEYGRQFQVEHYELQVPGTQDSILQYLSSGIIKGIGEKSAKKLVREFGDKTLEILRENPEQVAKLKGFSLNKARQIAEQLREKQDYQELVLFLTPLGISQGKILRIYRQFGADAMQLISENPFRLADEVYGIGFATADHLAQSMGLDPASPQRVASAIKYLLYQAASRGHTYFPLEHLSEEVSQLIGTSISADHPAVRTLQSDRQIVLSGQRFGDSSDQRVSLPSLFRAEKAAADRLSILLQTEPMRFQELIDQDAAAAVVSQHCAGQQIVLSGEQQDALVKALQNQVLILTGGPGTGKTTIIKMLCDCLINLGGRVLLAAPTGRAAKRMTETTGLEAKTLHRLLEIQYVPDESRQDFMPDRNTDVCLSCDLLIVDEMSMVD